jgi:hypothetical protein
MRGKGFDKPADAFCPRALVAITGALDALLSLMSWTKISSAQAGHFLSCSATVEVFQHLSLLASQLTSQLEPHRQFYNNWHEVL